MMNNGFTGAIVTASIKPATTPTTLILKQSALPYSPQAGDTLILRFSSAPYTPPAVV